MTKAVDTVSRWFNAGLGLLIEGPPGIAKTAILRTAFRAVHDDCDVPFVELGLGERERPDITGAFVVDHDRGITVQLPVEDVAHLHDAARTQRAVGLLLDDFGMASIEVQQAAIRLIDSLPNNVVVAITTNSITDQAGVVRMLEPVRTRIAGAYRMPVPNTDSSNEILLCSWQEHAKGWITWARDAGAPIEVIAYHRATAGERLYAHIPDRSPSARRPDFRSWETVGKLWNADMRDSHSIAGAIGIAAATEFLAWAEVADQVPAVEDVLARPDTIALPPEENPGALHVLIARLAASVDESHIPAIATLLNRLPAIWAALLVQDCSARLDQERARTNPLFLDSSIQRWIGKNPWWLTA